MPKISEFFGICIYVYFRDHNPPHFHVIYSEHKAAIKIDDLTIIEGKLPPRVYGMVVEWATMHQVELMDNWNKAAIPTSLEKIQPLK